MKIEIPEQISKKLQERVNRTNEFNNVEEYVNYILKQVVERLEKEKDTSQEEPVFSKEDEEKVKERLRGLGYLD